MDIISAEAFDNIKEADRDSYDFAVEEWFSNWERPYDVITKEEFFLMLLKFSEFIWEEWDLNEKFVINFHTWDAKNRPSEWATDACIFVISEDLSDWKNPKWELIKEEAWMIIFKFLKDYPQFQTVWRIDKYKDGVKRAEWVSDLAKRWHDWILKNKIWNVENPQSGISRSEVWTILLKTYEILEEY